MKINEKSQIPEDQHISDVATQKKSKKLLNENPLYQPNTQHTGGKMPKASPLKKEQDFSYQSAKENTEERKAIAKLLKPGDIIVVRVETSKSRDIIDKINHWFQKTFRSLYQTDKVKIQEKDIQVNHIILVTHVNEEKGEIVISESVTKGARTIDYFEHKGFGPKSGVTHEVFRPNLNATHAEINDAACKAMKMMTAAKPSVTSEEAKEGTKNAAPYSKVKAVRTLFRKGLGRNASAQKITHVMLDRYYEFERVSQADKSPKKQKVFCSQLVSSNLQFGVFRAAVANLKERDTNFANEIEKFSDPNRRITRSQYREFAAKYGARILTEMQDLCPQIKFSAGNMSPTSFSALLRNAGLGTHVCNIS